MNFLAHCYLSCHDEQLLMGNFLGDFLRLPEVRALPPALYEGVVLHRLIDSYTDAHPVVREGKRILYPYFSKYSPVVLDIFFDYLLAKNWDTYTEMKMQAFIDQTYAVIRKRIDLAPKRLHKRLEGMLQGRFLNEYTTWPGLNNTFARLRTFISRPDLILDPVPPLQQHEEALDQVFRAFFPDMLREVGAHCGC